MCCRYWIDPEHPKEVLRIIGEIRRLDPQLRVQTAGEIFPGDGVPVLCRTRAGQVRPFAMAWGYRLESGRRVLNARSETAATRPLFREGMRTHRCLLPMSAYFEWQKQEGKKEKVKFRIEPQAEDLHCLAGIFRFESGYPVCAVLTMPASPELAFIHPRMPLILTPAQCAPWLHSGELPSEAPPLRYTAEE